MHLPVLPGMVIVRRSLRTYHKTCSPSLCLLTQKRNMSKELQGLSLKNVKASIYQGQKLCMKLLENVIYSFWRKVDR